MVTPTVISCEMEITGDIERVRDVEAGQELKKANLLTSSKDATMWAGLVCSFLNKIPIS